MSLHQAYILLNNGVADLTIPFTTILRKSSSKHGMFKFTNIILKS